MHGDCEGNPRSCQEFHILAAIDVALNIRRE
jgi:hypothetical protein